MVGEFQRGVRHGGWRDSKKCHVNCTYALLVQLSLVLVSNPNRPISMSQVKQDKKNDKLYGSNEKDWKWTAVVVALVFSLVFAFKFSSSADYALCSRSSDIYTVDEAQPRVECIVVKDSRILDVGKQGKCTVMF